MQTHTYKHTHTGTRNQKELSEISEGFWRVYGSHFIREQLLWIVYDCTHMHVGTCMDTGMDIFISALTMSNDCFSRVTENLITEQHKGFTLLTICVC